MGIITSRENESYKYIFFKNRFFFSTSKHAVCVFAVFYVGQAVAARGPGASGPAHIDVHLRQPPEHCHMCSLKQIKNRTQLSAGELNRLCRDEHSQGKLQ